MADTSIDLEALIPQYLAGFGDGFKLYGGELPPSFETAGLPAVRVIELPGEELSRAWNGPGLLHRVEADVDVFAADSESVADAAALVRRRLEALRIPGASVDRAPAFTRRPDWNDKVRRRGAVLSLVTR